MRNTASPRRIDPLTIWEAMTGSALRTGSRSEFRRRPEYPALKRHAASALVLFGSAAQWRHPDRHLLLGEWLDAVLACEHLGSTDVEDEVRSALTDDGLHGAVLLARCRVAEGALDAEVATLTEQLVDLDARRAAREVEAVRASEAKEQEARERRERAERCRASAWQDAKRRQDLDLEADRERQAAAEASGRAARARADRKLPPVHDMGYEPRPWED